MHSKYKGDEYHGVSISYKFCKKLIINSFPPHFLSSAFFSRSTFSKNSLRNAFGVSNSLDPVQARHFVKYDLGTICLQRLWADGTRGQRDSTLVWCPFCTFRFIEHIGNVAVIKL